MVLAVLCIDDVNVRALLPKAKKRFATYGLSPEADLFRRRFERWRQPASNSRQCTKPRAWASCVCTCPAVIARTNALAAVAVAHELEIPFTQV
jgi:UDP-N-acetylmuramate-alanine ligase